MTVMLAATVVLGLIVAHGLFAGTELAVMAASRGRLKHLADAGNTHAAVALELTQGTDRFLATIQMALTLASTIAAMLAAAVLTPLLSERFTTIPQVAPWGFWLAFGLTAFVVTGLQVVLGELVPKFIALAEPDRWACLVAVPTRWLARGLMPVAWLVIHVCDALLRTVGIRRATESSVSILDIQQMLDEGTESGLLHPVERHLAAESLRLGDKMVRHVMSPRVEIDAADVDTPSDEILGVVLMSGFSRLPVYEGDLDHVLGFVRARDVMLQNYMGRSINLRKLLRPALFVPVTLPLDRLLVEFRQHKTSKALVVDELGRTVGLITLEDVVNELVGEILTGTQVRGIASRPEGGWLVEGRVPLLDLLDYLHRDRVTLPPHVQTVAGLVLEEVGRLPQAGDVAHWQGLLFEVSQLSGQRIEKVTVSVEMPQ